MKQHKLKSDGADVLRAIAILIVVAYHIFIPIYGSFLPWQGLLRNFEASPSPQLLWFYPITFGWAGVALFFVLSGFCIHLSFLQRGHFNITHFFWRRLWRIYPAYAIALLVFTIFARIDIFSIAGAKHLFTHALFLHNFSNLTFFSINPSFWSIATEVQLYLLFPVLIFLRSHFGIAGCLKISLAIGMFWRIIVVARWGIADHLIAPALTSPFMTWFDWMLGAFVAERFFHGKIAFNSKQIWLSILLPVFVISTFFKPFTIFSFSLAAAISAILLEISLYVNWQKSLLMTVTIFIATISYSIYLWHQPLLFPLNHQLAHEIGSGILPWAILMLLLVIGGWISFRCLEQPGIKIGSLIWKYFNR
jgi:peptidoglycan/LPS O-acetylase OafA/YrhL